MIVKNISRILNVSRKTFWVLAAAFLLSVTGAAQTPPANQGSLPQLPNPKQLLLEADLKINAAAVSTTNRSVTLDFTAREKGTGNVTVRDVTGNITHYRVLEDATPEVLSQQSWILITRRPPIFNLAERDNQRQRYGERRVVFQVKTETLTSNVVSDSITLEPILKKYRVSASANAHPLIQYAASQGFTFPLDYYETCKGSCPHGNILADPDLASGRADNILIDALASNADNSLVCVLGAAIGLGPLTCRLASAPAPAGTCTTKADYKLFEGRSPNPFWRIKSVDVSGAATVRPHGLNRFLVKFNRVNKDVTCFVGFIDIGDVVVEGPVEDDFVDAANPWKNAFVRGELTRPVGITNPRPN